METSVKSFFGGNLVPLITGLDGRKMLAWPANKLDARTETGFPLASIPRAMKSAKRRLLKRSAEYFAKSVVSKIPGTDFSCASVQSLHLHHFFPFGQL